MVKDESRRPPYDQGLTREVVRVAVESFSLEALEKSGESPSGMPRIIGPRFNGKVALWLTGTVSPRARQTLAERGFSVTEHAHLRVEVLD
jgi:hypothetical protein